ncbi:DMT family transporter [Hutsoniella sourekii]|uniref:DMT family transporter n=1 Tax=Hutsoniella sourekii TaxID=87650 RepID=UPI0004805890|nr:DMT family transporter [Hutsoniella sourekii]
MSNKLKGILLAGFGGSMWGVSGILAQIVFANYPASSEWLVSTRLFFAGICILLYAAFIRKEDITRIFKDKSDTLQLILFAVLGMVGVQYLFFKTIETSGASLATILQFTSPIFIYLYQIIRGEKHLRASELSLVLLTVFGVVLIVTNGSFAGLNVSLMGLITGLGSAVAVAFYTLQPRRIQGIYGSPLVVGWGMLFGGIVFQVFSPFWKPGFTLDGQAYLLLALIIVFGTAMAFLSYLSSTAYIEASLASIMTALEPLLAAVLTVVVFNKSFGFFEIVGIAIVLVAVLILSNMKEPETK